jgi:hypothetical protein
MAVQAHLTSESTTEAHIFVGRVSPQGVTRQEAASLVLVACALLSVGLRENPLTRPTPFKGIRIEDEKAEECDQAHTRRRG